MKKIGFYIAFLSICLYFLLPYVGEKIHYSQALKRGHWKRKLLVVDRDVFSYSESENNGSTIVMIHGFQADASHWSYYAEKFNAKKSVRS